MVISMNAKSEIPLTNRSVDHSHQRGVPRGLLWWGVLLVVIVVIILLFLADRILTYMITVDEIVSHLHIVRNLRLFLMYESGVEELLIYNPATHRWLEQVRVLDVTIPLNSRDFEFDPTTGLLWLVSEAGLLEERGKINGARSLPISGRCLFLERSSSDLSKLFLTLQKPDDSWELVEYDLDTQSERHVLTFSAMPIAVLCQGNTEVIYLDSAGDLYKFSSNQLSVLHNFGDFVRTDIRQIYLLRYDDQQVCLILRDQIYLISTSSGAMNELNELQTPVRSPIIINLEPRIPVKYLFYLSGRRDGRVQVRNVDESGRDTLLANIREKPLSLELYKQ